MFMKALHARWVCPRVALMAMLTFAVLSAGRTDAAQASITLTDSAATICLHNDTSWTIAKTGAVTNGTATWTVTVTKGATTHDELVVDGYVRVQNTGSGDATLGNIVVNLPRQKLVAKKTYWISAAADVADATSGDAATVGRVVASASAENAALNASNGPGNYTVGGAQGTFVEGAGSGALEFTDADLNTAFSLTPQPVLAPGQSVSLLFQAAFDNTVLGIPPGTQVRAEVLVSFGNAGARGGSGATAKNIDVNGNGALDSDEANVRTVPTRLTLTLPATVAACNAAVTLTDTDADIATTGTATFSNFATDIGGGSGTEVLTDSATRTVSCDVDGGASGGTVGNTAHLDGEDGTVTAVGPIDPNTGLPLYTYSFPCCVGIHDSASSVLEVGASEKFADGDYCTANAAKWAQGPAGPNPATVTSTDFASVYPGGFVEVGIPGSGGFSM
jgi:hypothetical protein